MPETENRSPLSARRELLICIAIVLSTAAVYSRAFSFGYVNYDDRLYVYENRFVQSGMSWENFRYAFSSTDTGNWYPLVWLTLMAETEVFGERPEIYHTTNILIHCAAAALLYLALVGLSGAALPSGLTAAAFALHPLHVESVAWIAERKDVLCALFWFATMGAYAWYSARGGAVRYGAVIAGCALALMSKPMAVTLPFALVLLDLWPLGRFRRLGWLRIIGEKLPLIAMSAAASMIALHAHAGVGGIRTTDDVAVTARLLNAVTAYAAYLYHTAWPVNLAVLYPFDETLLTPVRAGISGAVIAVITAAAILPARRAPYLGVGWLWYLGTLVPVIGIVQIGAQSMADRYTYIPLVGIFAAVFWGACEAAERSSYRRLAVVAGSFVLLAAWSGLAWRQVGYWRDSETLFRRALAVTERNGIAHVNLAHALLERKAYAEAEEHLELAVALRPGYARPYYLMGELWHARRNLMKALAAYTRALSLSPRDIPTHLGIAAVHLEAGQLDLAEQSYRTVIEINPGHLGARTNLGIVLAREGKFAEAVEVFEQALALNPHDVNVLLNYGVTLVQSGRQAEAIGVLERAAALSPGDPDVAAALAAVRAMGRPG